MPRLFTPILCLFFFGCIPNAESVVNRAIAAADDNNPTAFLKTLDAPSATLVSRAASVGNSLPREWTWMEGAPWKLLAGATIVAKEEVSEQAMRFNLQSPSSQITELWVLKTDDGPLPRWQIHLLGSKGIFSSMKVVNH